MVQTIAAKTDLYNYDYLRWVEEVVNKLRTRDFEHLDIENLIEEIEDLGKSEKKELLNRLAILLEHLLKRIYINMPQEFNGWERTIREHRRQIKRAIKFSPSLAQLFDQFFDEAFEEAIDEVRKEKGYQSVQFPSTWQFSRNLDAMLNIDFWELLNEH